MPQVDLNALHIDDETQSGVPISSMRKSCKYGFIEVHFTDLESRLCEEIRRWPAVVGCVAWLTNPRILGALATREAVSIIVQKEDWLRPDIGGWTKARLRDLYTKIPEFNRYEAPTAYSYCSDPTLPGVMCLGVAAARKEVPPRMHHKFFVFGYIQEQKGESGKFVGRKVWTGSFNPTTNATASLENAIVVENPEVAAAYVNEWDVLVGLCEPLNWESEYVAPIYRIGS